MIETSSYSYPFLLGGWEKGLSLCSLLCVWFRDRDRVGRCGPAFENSWFGGHSPRFPSVLSPLCFFSQPPKDRNVESH